MLSSLGSRLLDGLFRFFYAHFYNRLAFTYDPVSALVSRGQWREWTRAAIPFIRGTRVLEVAFGTGNLQLDLHEAGQSPFGVELSSYMVDITRRKFRSRRLAPALVRGRVQTLPFVPNTFDSAILTFPPSFVFERDAVAELGRVLARDGRVIWVDSPLLYPVDAWSRFLNWALSMSGGRSSPAAAGEGKGETEMRVWTEAGWTWRSKEVALARSSIHVILLERSPRPAGA